MDLKKMRACAPLLPPPGDEVVVQCLDEIERLQSCLKYEQHRVERIGTHAEGCWAWGPAHYECAIREMHILREMLDIERTRLAACGVVAMANTSGSAAKARDMLPEYRSGSCDEVACTVDREMLYREQNVKFLALLTGCSATLAMWADVAPALNLRADIDRAIAEHSANKS